MQPASEQPRDDAGLEVYGDSAYGSGEARAAYRDAGHDTVIKPGPLRPAVPGGFTIDDFTVDEEQGTVDLPGRRQARPMSGKRTVTFGAACAGCPLRDLCTTAKDGRSMTIHPHEGLLRAARAQARTAGVQAGLPDPVGHRAGHRLGRHPERPPDQAALHRNRQERRLAAYPVRRAEPADPAQGRADALRRGLGRWPDRPGPARPVSRRPGQPRPRAPRTPPGPLPRQPRPRTAGTAVTQRSAHRGAARGVGLIQRRPRAAAPGEQDTPGPGLKLATAHPWRAQTPKDPAQFKSLKYRPYFPARFTSIEHARAHCQDFLSWYNHEHRHGGLGLHTGANMHHAHATAIQAERAQVLAAAYRAHPERFVSMPPAPPDLSCTSWINPPRRKKPPLSKTHLTAPHSG